MKARPICIWIKGAQRRRCVLLRATLPCRHGASDRKERRQQSEAPRMETSERRARFHAACLKLEVSRATNYRRRGRNTFIFLFFFSPPLFSRSSTRQHDYSAGTERENAWKHRYEMKPDRRYSAASYQGSLQKVVLLSSALPPFFCGCFSPCVISPFHLHLSLQFPRSPSSLI